MGKSRIAPTTAKPKADSLVRADFVFYLGQYINMLKQILPKVIIMENVEEIQQWGPLDEKGCPIKERQGEDYKKFITAMKGLGYRFNSRELVSSRLRSTYYKKTVVCNIPQRWKGYCLAGADTF